MLTQPQQSGAMPGAGNGIAPGGAAGSGAAGASVAGVGAAGVAAVGVGAAGVASTMAGSLAAAGVGAATNGGAGGVVAGTSGAAGGAGAAVSGGASGAAGAAGSAADDTCPGTPLEVGDHTYMINSANGLMYSYILSVPKTVDPSKRAPVIVHWHALSSDPEEARAVTSVDAKAEAAQMLVVYPRSPDKSWDAGSCCTTTVNGKRRDEEVFARELIKDVVAKACVDQHRIYTNGFSNGGMISQMLSCKMADVFAAAAPMGSTLTSPQAECKPSRPIPMFLINGTADPLVGYNAPGFAGGISVPNDVKFWADQNKCMGMPEMFLQMGKATCSHYTQCAAGVEVAYCSVEGMGHCVPGMKKESATTCLTKSGIALGMPNDDIDAVQMDFDFLKRFTL
jgi:polyhydroxybutyrate depolymerase